MVGLDLLLEGNIIKVPLITALEPASTRDLEPRSMLCFKRTFPKKYEQNNYFQREKVIYRILGKEVFPILNYTFANKVQHFITVIAQDL